MILFHGSDVIISHVDLTQSKPCKDFGRGFYLSDDFRQALAMAQFKSRLTGGDPVVSEFEFDKDQALASKVLNVRLFDGYTDEWADFVFKNRQTDISPCEYDFVYGPIADDRVGLQIRKLNDGIINRDEFLRRLMYMKGITFQYFFGSEQALSFLKPI